jgi:hypothetical protein
MISPVVNYSVVSGQEDSNARKNREYRSAMPLCYLPFCFLFQCIPGCTGTCQQKWYTTYSLSMMGIFVVFVLLTLGYKFVVGGK